MRNQSLGIFDYDDTDNATQFGNIGDRCGVSKLETIYLILRVYKYSVIFVTTPFLKVHYYFSIRNKLKILLGQNIHFTKITA
jgi:hypothetical protein